MAYYLNKIVGDIDKLTIFEFDIKTSPELKKIARRLRDRGFNQTASTLRTSSLGLGTTLLNNLLLEAHEVAYRHMPYDSGQLRSNFLDIKFLTTNSESLSGEVFVRNGQHLGRKRKDPESAPVLAMFLNKNALKRSKTSGTTKDWVTDAQLEFQQKLPSLIDSSIRGTTIKGTSLK